MQRIRQRWVIRLSALLALVAGTAGCGEKAGFLGLQDQSAEPAPAESGRVSDGLRGLLDRIQPLTTFALPDDLQDDLAEADAVLSRIRRENRLALRNVNRQVRVKTPVRSPNVVLIVVPRLGANDLGSYGQERIPTPNLDRLAAEGVRFTDFHAGSPDPAASRWSLMSGLSPSRTTDRDAPQYLLRPQDCTLAEMLWQANYDTGFVGAWQGPEAADDDNTPLQHGFEEWVGTLRESEAGDPTPETIWLGDKTRLPVNLQDPPKFHAGDVFSREAIAYVEAHRSSSRPFFLQYHLPNYVEYPAAILDRVLPPQAGWPVSAQRYAGAVTLMDRDIGRLTAALELLGVRQRTAMFFTALSGPDLRHAEALRFLQSTSPYAMAPHQLAEGNLRVPLLASFPASFPQGRVVPVPAVMWDLHPTFAHVTWANRKPSLWDGISLVPAVRRTPATDRLLYWQFNGGQAARLGQWKGIRPPGALDVALFDLTTDPGETRDVSAAHPDIMRRLTVPVPAP